VLRWDGTCATIREEMLVSYVPAPMQSPRIIWKYLDVGSQDALSKNSVVARSLEAQKKGCHDSSLTHPNSALRKIHAPVDRRHRTGRAPKHRAAWQRLAPRLDQVARGPDAHSARSTITPCCTVSWR